jgi:hypothetical protein
MAKAHDTAFAFLQKAKAPSHEPFKESFETTKPAAMNSFRGMFGEAKLSEQEKERLHHLLHDFLEGSTPQDDKIAEDYQTLSRITSEIKSISNQSILLHGERIKKAQQLLKGYKEGAFSAWLVATYGNRQTPYSMLQYYELYHILPDPVRPLIEHLPKKAAYTLASRDGSLEEKVDIIREYKGERQRDVILLIQKKFPCAEYDKRRRPTSLVSEIEKLVRQLEAASLSSEEKKHLLLLVERCQKIART